MNHQSTRSKGDLKDASTSLDHEELETANIMMGEGASFSDIAKKLDRTASAVESKLKGKKPPQRGSGVQIEACG